MTGIPDKKPIHDFLIHHAGQNPVSFHMPGHKGSTFYRRFGLDAFLENWMDCDITEIIGADNLFQAEGIIKETQDAYAMLYGVQRSYLLVNGTSGGILAAILSVLGRISGTVPEMLILARNSHKSVFNALALAGGKPIYAYPELIPEFGISGAIAPKEIETLLQENPDAQAVILPSPNYYGICSDIDAIAKIVHRHGKILIVDQAHGAHLPLFHKFGRKDFPQSAEQAGADIVINSIHKTLASFTQSAILNLNSDRMSPYLIEDKLQCIESTSPSYLLMASLDINAWILQTHGQELMSEWAENLDYFYQEAAKIPGLALIGKRPGMDWTKLNLSFGSLGISGEELEKRLLEYDIFIELYTGDLVMCMTGIGTTKEDLDRLLFALRDISHKHSLDPERMKKEKRTHDNKEYNALAAFPKLPVHEIPTNKKWVSLADAEGLICASSVIPYPPGIPLICPGERFEKNRIDYIKALREKKEKVIGVNDRGEVLVGHTD